MPVLGRPSVAAVVLAGTVVATTWAGALATGVEVSDERQATAARDACLAVAGSESATDEQIARDVISGAAQVVGAGASCADGHARVIATPHANLEDVHETAWERVEVAADGRTLTVLYSHGDEYCYALDRVDVTTTDTGLEVRVFVGSIPGIDACDLLKQQYVTLVELDEPVVDGGQDDDG